MYISVGCIYVVCAANKNCTNYNYMTEAPPTVTGLGTIRVMHVLTSVQCGKMCVYQTDIARLPNTHYGGFTHENMPHIRICKYGSSFFYSTCTYGDAKGLAELALIIKSGKVTANIQALGERKNKNIYRQYNMADQMKRELYRALQ